MKTIKTLVLSVALITGYSCNAQSKYEKAQQGINTLISIKEIPITYGTYPVVKLCDMTIPSTGVKISSVKVIESGHTGYIDKPELVGLINALKKMQKLLTDNPDDYTEYVYRLSGGLTFYANNAEKIRIIWEDGYSDLVTLANLIEYLEAAKNGDTSRAKK